MKIVGIAILVVVLSFAVSMPLVSAHSVGGRGGGGGGSVKDTSANQPITVKYPQPGLFGIKGLTVEKLNEKIDKWSKPENIDKHINSAYQHMRDNPTVHEKKKVADPEDLRALRDLVILSQGGSKALEKDRKNREPEDIMNFMQILMLQHYLSGH